MLMLPWLCVGWKGCCWRDRVWYVGRGRRIGVRVACTAGWRGQAWWTEDVGDCIAVRVRWCGGTVVRLEETTSKAKW